MSRGCDTTEEYNHNPNEWVSSIYNLITEIGGLLPNYPVGCNNNLLFSLFSLLTLY